MRYVLYLLVTLLFSNCSSSEKDSNESKFGLIFNSDRIEFELEQRHSITLDGYNKKLTVLIGDITRGKTIIVLETDKSLILRHEITELETIPFSFDQKDYKLFCSRLQNNLIGSDFAYFTIFPSNEEEITLPEEKDMVKKEIEVFIQFIRTSEVVFIRNGVEYEADQAADHLESKWRNSGVEFNTLEEFIEQIASKSSQTGRPYQIKFKDGTIMDAKEWMMQQIED